MAAQNLPDFILYCEGNIWLFTPQTVAAFQFLKDHIPADAVYLGSSLVVDQHYIDGLLCRLSEHGLKVVSR